MATGSNTEIKDLSSAKATKASMVDLTIINKEIITDTMDTMGTTDITDTDIIDLFIHKIFPFSVKNDSINLRQKCKEMIKKSLQASSKYIFYLQTFINSCFKSISNMSESYQVEAILDKRAVKRGNTTHKEYFVKWVGYQIEESTWEPIKNLKNVMQMIEEFEKFEEEQQKTQTVPQKENVKEKSSQKPSAQTKDPPQCEQKQGSNNKFANKQEPDQEGSASDFKEPSDSEPEEQPPRKMLKKEIKTTKAAKKIKEKSLPKIAQKKRQADLKVVPPKSSTSENEIYETSVYSENSVDEKENEGKLTVSSDGASPEEKETLEVLGMCRNHKNQFMFWVENNSGLRSYKTRSYMIDKHPETLICFYESKILFSNPLDQV